MKDTIYFLSDAHLGITINKSKHREELLIQFLKQIKKSASHLFIVGDLFDFWIEYTQAIRPVYFNILCELKSLILAGCEIHYLAGNHDFALGPFLTQTIGIKVYPHHLNINLQGKNLFITHGDGMLASDRGYRFWRQILRNPINQWFYKLLHPNFGVALASFVSGSSRHFTSKQYNEIRRKEYLKEATVYLRRGADIVVIGHTHHPELYHIDDKIYCNTGEWLFKFSYAKMTNGILSLWQYRNEQADLAIKPYEK